MAQPGKPTPIPLDQRLFRDLPPDRYPKPDINPYLKLLWNHGPPVLRTDDAASWRGGWGGAYGREAPLHVEVGTGNGFFLAGMSARHPEFNWLGIEIRFKRVVLTARKIDAAGSGENARVARYDANALTDLFAPGDVSCLYLNHPDPWPKDRHAKNRLICGDWLDVVCELLAPRGELKIKTDHLINVQALLDNLPGRPLELLGRSDDVNGQGPPWESDVVTNYQSKFAKRGLPVYALWLRKT